MRTRSLTTIALAATMGIFSFCTPVRATTFRVWTNGTHTAPYDTWTKAATNISAAVSSATNASDIVLLTNGVYVISARIDITNAITLTSVGGPGVTLIDPAGSCIGFYMTNAAALLSGITVTNGYGDGAGAWMFAGTISNCVFREGNSLYEGHGGGIKMSGGLVTHCVVSNNSVNGGQSGRYTEGGGGVYMTGGILQNSVIVDNWTIGAGDGGAYCAGGGVRATAGLVRNCLIKGNTASSVLRGYGGGVGVSGSGVILNCTIVDNLAGGSAGGVSSSNRSGGYVTNCIIYNNTCTQVGFPHDIDEPGIAAYSCSPDLTDGTNGNITANPLFVDSATDNYRISLGSPCRNGGTNAGSIGSFELDDGARIYAGDGVSVVDMGAYEVGTGIAALQCDFSGTPAAGIAPLEVVFTATVLGPNTNNLYYWWDFENNASVDTNAFGLRVVTNTYSAGLYSVKLTVSNAISEVTNSVRIGYITCPASTVYVSTNGSHTAPYDTWTKAATNFSTAMAFQQAGGTVLLSNGTYWVTQQTTLDEAKTVASMNGPTVTTVQRQSGDIRIFSLSHSNAIVSGLSIADGNNQDGAGVYMDAGTVSNCIIRDGYAKYDGHGGGIQMTGGLVTHCVITNNDVNGQQSGRYTEGGGGIYMTGGTVQNSIVVDNWTIGHANSGHCAGGGIRALAGLIRNCLIKDNIAEHVVKGYGGGVGISGTARLINCTVVGNTAGGSGGGVSSIGQAGGYVTNCIIYNNICTTEGNPIDLDETPIFAFSCSPDLTNGVNNNITASPDFIDAASGDYRPQLASPVRNAGTNVADIGSTDLDDEQRVFESIPDMGAYEISGSILECDFSASPQAGQAPLQTVFTAVFVGNTNGLYYWWDFENDASVDANGFGLRVVTNTYVSGGLYSVKLTVSNAISEVTNQVRLNYITCVPDTIYVATNGSHTLPYETLAKAATNVADAVSFQQAGGTVLVSNGTFWVTSQLTLDKGITITSINGPEVTTIQRQSGTMRIFSISDPAALVSGLTIADGYATDGAGAFISDGIISNCIIRDGYAKYEGHGGGIKMTGGLVTHCVITNNRVDGGQSGRYTEGGGGVYMTGGILQNSVIVDNWTIGAGNGTAYCAGGGVRSTAGIVRNCLIRGNTAASALRGYGGGVGVSDSGVIINCTIVHNLAGGSAGGVSSSNRAGGYVTNCIIYNNTCTTGGKPDDIDEPGIAAYSCSPDLTNGVNNNISDDPMFVDTNSVNYQLKAGSPCINSGIDQAWMVGASDLGGKMRILTGNVDIGCYESTTRMGTIFVLR